ncbi:MAG: DUF1345 domain-containing protein [Pseudolabrys sp.]
MAKKKPAAPIPRVLPLPVRVAKLHAKLIIAAMLGLTVIGFLPGDWRWPTRLIVGWDVGLALYLCLTYTTMSTCTVEQIRKRAAEEDEGEFFILLLSAAATMASLVAIVFELGG